MSLLKVDLKGKVALVTGGSRGIGRACALGFAENGANVAIASRHQADLEKVVEEIKARGQKGLAVATDVGKIEDLKNLVAKTKAEFGRIDILMNNAGTEFGSGPITLIDVQEQSWDSMMSINLKAPFLLGQMVAKIMREQGGGSIINTASVAGIRPGRVHLYSVSKAGLIMLTRLMAKEWGQYKIRVNALAPGILDTELSVAFWKDPVMAQKISDTIPLLHRGLPDDIVGAVLFLASDAASFVTGHTLVVDGGATCGPPSYRNRK